ncbi:hypothetical protein TAMA11512_22010 [Selenomonas sp. TAMA-11512]|uniref:HAD-IA family hydrolase n=1 Tax=Selenomonas sp. TAMA-11512 TaxID=3095337 RepID=UPI003092DE7D|nr:hypothetical protein TAMA11512_22010 [Selenomonas sp. TAMA-11512]
MDVVAKEFVTAFEDTFAFLKGKRIVLYGIGYRTGALIDLLGKAYDFVGVMDKDAGNVGKLFFGRPCLAQEEIPACADCIIIVSVTFYDVIFKRIADLWIKDGIPIYFPNGEQAKVEPRGFNALPTEQESLSMETLQAEIRAHDVVSFDLFDTLIMRKTLDADAVFALVEEGGFPGFRKARKAAYQEAQRLHRVPRAKDIYAAMAHMGSLEEDEAQRMREAEQAAEHRALLVREDMRACLWYALECNKEVYIVTDIYMSQDDIYKLLQSFKIDIPKNNVIVSSEYGKSKEDGGLFSVLAEREKGKRILHIGDDRYSDVQGAKKYGIDAIQILSAKDIMRHTALNPLLAEGDSLFDNISLGLLGAKLFSSPFSGGRRLDTNGKIILHTPEEVGYTAYGPLIFSFLSYILNTCLEKGFSKLCFCARDGYLLKEAMDVYLSLCGVVGIETRYLKISRLLARRLLLTDSQAAEAFAALSYRGTARDFFQERFGVEVADDTVVEVPSDTDRLRPLLLGRMEEVLEKSAKLRMRYRTYLREEIGDLSHAALVDFGYTGSTQQAMSRFLEQPLAGIYLLADMSKGNPENEGQRKFSYGYSPSDPSGAKSPIQKLFLLLEAIYTAPYGTYMTMDETGFVTAAKASNQKYFGIKQKVHQGVLEFISDMMVMLGKRMGAASDQSLLGIALMQTMFGRDVAIADDIRKTFYMDDIFRYRSDRSLFDEKG